MLGPVLSVPMALSKRWLDWRVAQPMPTRSPSWGSLEEKERKKERKEFIVPFVCVLLFHCERDK